MDVKKLIGDYLAEARMLQIATAVDNQPWCVTVYFAYDGGWNLYWISKPDRRHSKELRENPKIAGVIVLSHTPGDKVRGLSVEGDAREVTGKDEVAKLIAHYQKRMGTPDDRIQNIINDTDGHRLYVIKPRSFVLFDELNFPNDPRRELKV